MDTLMFLVRLQESALDFDSSVSMIVKLAFGGRGGQSDRAGKVGSEAGHAEGDLACCQKRGVTLHDAVALDGIGGAL